MSPPRSVDPNEAGPLPAGRHGLSREVVENSQRERLMAAMIAATNDLGYARVTVDEVARRARTAKRTFYEFYADKEACLVETYDTIMSRLLATVMTAANDADPPEEQVLRGLSAALAAMDQFPAAARFALIECPSATKAMPLQRARVMEGFATALRDRHEQARRTWSDLAPLTPNAPLAMVGALLEPIVMQILQRPGEPLQDLHPELDGILRLMMLGRST